MTHRIVLGIVSTGLVMGACQPRPTGGCLKDTDCKGHRVCVKHTCVEPTERCRCPPLSTRPRVRARPRPRPIQVRIGPPATAVAMFRVDHLRQGRSQYAGPTTRPKLLWWRKLGGAISASPSLGKDGTIYVGSHDRSVYAFTAAGTRRWQHRTGDKVWSSAAVAKDGKTLYVGSDDDHLYGFDAARGTIRFKLRLGSCQQPGGTKGKAKGKGKAKTMSHGAKCDIDSSPAVGPDGTIYVGGDGLSAVSPTGKLRWHFKTPQRIASSPAVLPSSTVIFGSQDDRVYAVDARGKLKWSYPAGGDVDSSPAIGADGTVYVGTDDGRLLALWPDGTFRWAVLTGGPVRSSPALGGDGTIYVGSYDGRLYAVDARGRTKWVLTTGGRIHASPVVDAQGRIYVSSQDRLLYAVAPNGTLLWQWRFPADVDSTVAISAKGRLHVGCDNGVLYTFE
ncbi:MAG: PQQ-binding-like beta-propeller repeat protein [bacterium]